MESTVTFSPGCPEITAVLSGSATIEELKSFVEALEGDPRWRPDVRALCDFTQLDARLLDGDAVREWAAYLRSKQDVFGSSSFGCVAGDPLAFGLGRQTASLTDRATFEIRFFRDRGAALAWLEETARSGRAPDGSTMTFGG